MLKLVPAFVLVGLFLLESFSADRDDIIEEYEPILSERYTALWDWYYDLEDARVAYKIGLTDRTQEVVRGISNDLVRVRHAISNAKKSADASALSCIESIESEMQDLNSELIFETCLCTPDYSGVTFATETAFVLMKVPNNTIPACGELFPIANQDSGFIKCMTDKLDDLAVQREFLQNFYDTSASETDETNAQCLAGDCAALGERIQGIATDISNC